MADSQDSLEVSLLRLKLIQALKAGEHAAIDDLLEKNPIILNQPFGGVSSQGLRLLHLAVQVAPLSCIQYLVSTYPGSRYPGMDVNASESEHGNTPLHLAALYGRNDVVLYLLSLPNINDCILNKEGKQAVEVTRTPELAEAMQIARAQYVEHVAASLKSLLAHQNLDELDALLSTPRAAALLDINGQDPDTGSTVLHDFVRQRNYKMVEFLLSHGGDPFRRDRKGVLPVDVAKDEAIKKLLKASTKEQAVILPAAGIPVEKSGSRSRSIRKNNNRSLSDLVETASTTSLSAAPAIKGYLKKWTNFTGGYKLRWFVLEDGVLSYYKRQDDTERACRGSINMKQAQLHLDSSEKLRFEILSRGSVKFHLKANHPVETSRWVWALTNAIQFAKDQDAKRSRGTATPSIHSLLPSQSQLSVISNESGSENIKKFLSPGNVETTRFAGHKFSESLSGSMMSYSASEDEEAVDLKNNQHLKGLDDLDVEEDDYEDEEGSVLEDAVGDEAPPLENQTGYVEDTISVELKSIQDLLNALHTQRNSGDLSDEQLGLSLTALESAMQALSVAMNSYVNGVNAREKFFLRRIERDAELQRMWEQNIKQLELEQEKIQESLHKAILKKKQATRLLKDVTSPEPGSGNRRKSSVLDERLVNYLRHSLSLQSDIPLTEEGVEKGTSAEAAEAAAAVAAVVSESESDSDEEFFDVEGEEGDADTEEEAEPSKPEDLEETSQTAEESNLSDVQKQKLEVLQEEKSWNGYEDGIRKKLDMDEDDRPRISLWGILKNLIGKDMTRMTLPVSFNECTSLLQRSAEDMEYTDLLDNAAASTDPGERMAYVAAFAASSYSSTINRIAKPFNPLLGETYEYARPDKGYRLFAEQVSHHPPIGALIAESTRWDFYGESAVKSKFNGRSFDIRPLGLWYLNLRPDTVDGQEVKEEIYSYRKVTSSVVGIITGSPVVDNYGDMEITNHTLGYKCLLKFKSRGWRGAGAYELKGTVTNEKGKGVWAVGGRWNDKIYGKKLNVDFEDGDDDVATVQNLTPSTTNASGVGAKGVKVLWKVHERIKAPFNLTPFAITLNALQPSLASWLPATDTRLRPDQRAMEEGRYDDASTEKNRVEEKQRAARRVLEINGETYKPSYFVKRPSHSVTGEPFWEYTGEYWKLRADHHLKHGDIF